MQAITTKFIAATNTKGERVKATAASGVSVTIPWSYSGDTEACHFEALTALCKKLDWQGEFIAGGTKTGFVWVFTSGHKYTIN